MEYIIAIIVLLLGIALGYLLKYFTKEEIKTGKKYFKVIWILSLILAGILFFIPIEIKLKQTAIFSLLFISIVSFISWKG